MPSILVMQDHIIGFDIYVLNLVITGMPSIQNGYVFGDINVVKF